MGKNLYKLVAFSNGYSIFKNDKLIYTDSSMHNCSCPTVSKDNGFMYSNNWIWHINLNNGQKTKIKQLSTSLIDMTSDEQYIYYSYNNSIRQRVASNNPNASEFNIFSGKARSLTITPHKLFFIESSNYNTSGRLNCITLSNSSITRNCVDDYDSFTAICSDGYMLYCALRDGDSTSSLRWMTAYSIAFDKFYKIYGKVSCKRWMTTDGQNLYFTDDDLGHDMSLVKYPLQPVFNVMWQNNPFKMNNRPAYFPISDGKYVNYFSDNGDFYKIPITAEYKYGNKETELMSASTSDYAYNHIGCTNYSVKSVYAYLSSTRRAEIYVNGLLKKSININCTSLYVHKNYVYLKLGTAITRYDINTDIYEEYIPYTANVGKGLCADDNYVYFLDTSFHAKKYNIKTKQIESFISEVSGSSWINECEDIVIDKYNSDDEYIYFIPKNTAYISRLKKTDTNAQSAINYIELPNTFGNMPVTCASISNGYFYFAVYDKYSTSTIKPRNMYRKNLSVTSTKTTRILSDFNVYDFAIAPPNHKQLYIVGALKKYSADTCNIYGINEESLSYSEIPLTTYQSGQNITKIKTDGRYVFSNDKASYGTTIGNVHVYNCNAVGQEDKDDVPKLSQIIREGSLGLNYEDIYFDDTRPTFPDIVPQIAQIQQYNNSWFTYSDSSSSKPTCYAYPTIKLEYDGEASEVQSKVHFKVTGADGTITNYVVNSNSKTIKSPIPFNKNVVTTDNCLVDFSVAIEDSDGIITEYSTVKTLFAKIQPPTGNITTVNGLDISDNSQDNPLNITSKIVNVKWNYNDVNPLLQKAVIVSVMESGSGYTKTYYQSEQSFDVELKYLGTDSTIKIGVMNEGRVTTTFTRTIYLSSKGKPTLKTIDGKAVSTTESTPTISNNRPIISWDFSSPSDPSAELYYLYYDLFNISTNQWIKQNEYIKVPSGTPQSSSLVIPEVFIPQNKYKLRIKCRPKQRVTSEYSDWIYFNSTESEPPLKPIILTVNDKEPSSDVSLPTFSMPSPTITWKYEDVEGYEQGKIILNVFNVTDNIIVQDAFIKNTTDTTYTFDGALILPMNKIYRISMKVANKYDAISVKSDDFYITTKECHADLPVWDMLENQRVPRDNITITMIIGLDENDFKQDFKLTYQEFHWNDDTSEFSIPIGNEKIIESKNSQVGWEVWNGIEWTQLPYGGVKQTDYIKVRYTFPSSLNRNSRYKFNAQSYCHNHMGYGSKNIDLNIRCGNKLGVKTKILDAETQPMSVIGLFIGNSNIQIGLKQTVKVTNNANDDNPVWEDATMEIINGGRAYNFTNKTKTAIKWGVQIQTDIEVDSTVLDNVFLSVMGFSIKTK